MKAVLLGFAFLTSAAAAQTHFVCPPLLALQGDVAPLGGIVEAYTQLLRAAPLSAQQIFRVLRTKKYFDWGPAETSEAAVVRDGLKALERFAVERVSEAPALASALKRVLGAEFKNRKQVTERAERVAKWRIDVSPPMIGEMALGPVVSRVALSRDEKAIFVANDSLSSSGKRVKSASLSLWDWDSPSGPVAKVASYAWRATPFLPSRDGSVLLLGAGSRGVQGVDRLSALNLEGVRSAGDGQIKQVVIGPGASRIAITREPWSTRVYELGPDGSVGNQVSIYDTFNRSLFGFTPDEKHLVVRRNTGEYGFYELAKVSSYHEVVPTDADLATSPTEIALSPSRRTFALASYRSGRAGIVQIADGSVFALDDAEPFLPPPVGMQDSVLAFSPDGKRLAAALKSGYVVLWDVSSGQLERVWKAQEPAHLGGFSIEFSSHGRKLLTWAAGVESSTVRLWEL